MSPSCLSPRSQYLLALQPSSIFAGVLHLCRSNTYPLVVCQGFVFCTRSVLRCRWLLVAGCLNWSATLLRPRWPTVPNIFSPRPERFLNGVPPHWFACFAQGILWYLCRLLHPRSQRVRAHCLLHHLYSYVVRTCNRYRLRAPRRRSHASCHPTQGSALLVSCHMVVRPICG